MRRIPESEYTAFVDELLLDIQRKIARSGLTISEIARGTRMKWTTVYNASQGVAVRIESACRIVYFLQKAKEEQSHEENKS